MCLKYRDKVGYFDINRSTSFRELNSSFSFYFHLQIWKKIIKNQLRKVKKNRHVSFTACRAQIFFSNLTQALFLVSGAKS